MDSGLVSERNRNCPNRVEDKVITVHQGGFLSLVRCMSSTSIYHCLAPTRRAPYKSTVITLRNRVPFYNKCLFEVLESLWWKRTPTNTYVKPIPYILDGIEVGTHCWPFHLLNVLFSRDSSDDTRYISPGIIVNLYIL